MPTLLYHALFTIRRHNDTASASVYFIQRLLTFILPETVCMRDLAVFCSIYKTSGSGVQRAQSPPQELELMTCMYIYVDSVHRLLRLPNETRW